MPTKDYECGYDCPKGWRSIVDPVLDKIEAMPGVTITQVKQKFGGLRIYIAVAGADSATHPARKLIEEATEICLRVCELCGGEGDRANSTASGIRTICVPCNEVRKRGA